jgi:hypothetical protein
MARVKQANPKRKLPGTNAVINKRKKKAPATTSSSATKKRKIRDLSLHPTLKEHHEVDRDERNEALAREWDTYPEQAQGELDRNAYL